MVGIEGLFLAGERWRDTRLVFTSHLGVALDAANVRKMFKRVSKAAGVGDGWTPRELGTSFMSLMSHHGVSIQEIARLVGQASTRTTEVVHPPGAAASDHHSRRNHGRDPRRRPGFPRTVDTLI
jgi:hypothetical protein